MQIVKKFFTQEFISSKSKKDAYLKACKFVATKVLNKKDADKILINTKIIDNSEDSFKCEVTLYISIDETESRNKFCDICKEFHHSFYINQDFNCNACKMLSYRKRLEAQISNTANYKKQHIKYLLNKD